jgi:S1-C subfamily serine protease
VSYHPDDADTLTSERPLGPEGTWQWPPVDEPVRPQPGWGGGPGGPGWPPADPGWWDPMSTPPARRRRRRGLTALLVVLALLAAEALGMGIGHTVWGPSASRAASPASPAPAPNNPFFFGGPGGEGGGVFGGQPVGGGSGGTSQASGSPANVAAIAAKVAPAVVDINVNFSYQNAQGAGTGIVLTSNGVVLTNNHVIDGATSINVTDVGNGRTYSASVLGFDPSQDVALIQLHGASGLRTAKLATSAPSVGQPVVALGNAGGAGGTPSSAGGSITAVDQSISASDQLDGSSEQLSGLIEVNADIQSGDSGGPLVDTSGRVLGMDTAASDQFSFQSNGGQGFAIPVDQAYSVAKRIRSGQGTDLIHVGAAAFLGVMVSPSGSQSFGSGGFGGFGSGGQSGNGSTVPGAYVSGTVPGTAARQLGLASGDVITSLGGQAVSSSSVLSQLMLLHHPGDRVSIGWTDSSGQSHTASVQLGSGPPA